MRTLDKISGNERRWEGEGKEKSPTLRERGGFGCCRKHATKMIETYFNSWPVMV